MTVEDFLKEKGIVIDHYVIHDISGNYMAPIPLGTWIKEYHQAEIKTTLIKFINQICPNDDKDDNESYVNEFIKNNLL